MHESVLVINAPHGVCNYHVPGDVQWVWGGMYCQENWMTERKCIWKNWGKVAVGSDVPAWCPLTPTHHPGLLGRVALALLPKCALCITAGRILHCKLPVRKPVYEC